MIWENRVMRSKPSSNTKPWKKKKKRAHSRHFARAKKLLSPQQESKGKKRRLNKKVSSAVFRAWTDKQREFYVCAKCNLTLQTSFIHWNILPPCTAQKKVAGIWTPTSVKRRSAMWFALRFISPHRCFPAGLKVLRIQTLNGSQHCQAPVKVKQQQAPCSLAWGHRLLQPCSHGKCGDLLVMAAWFVSWEPDKWLLNQKRT